MKKISLQQKILVILGPTASGKSDLAVRLAKKFNGEVISADSRQIYKELNIGTGKITKKEMQGVPHHMLDVVSPKSREKFTVQKYQKQSQKIIQDILQRNKLPIICGGTGFYIQALIDNKIFPEVMPNKILRKKLETKSAAELFTMLKKLDPERAEFIDKHNPVRLLRAIEIAKALGSVPRLEASLPKYDALQIGIKTDDKILREKIHTRLVARTKAGMVKEAQKLHVSGMSWKRMEELGLEYRYLALYLQNKLSQEEMLAKLESEIWHYAKRQKTWFKKDQRIKWFRISEEKRIEKEINNFLK